MKCILRSVLYTGVVLVVFHSPFSYTTCAQQGPLDDDDFQINRDDIPLHVAIDPPLRISLFETSQSLSASGVQAFVKAVSDFATARMQLYFLSRYGNNTYIFEAVKFEVLDVEPLTEITSQRALYEGDYEDQNMSMDPYNVNRRGTRRSLQTLSSNVVYGTSFVLGGNFTFEAIPTAPKQECNRKLQSHMTKYVGLAQEIQAQNHPELRPRSIDPLLTTILTPFPTSAPTTSEPTQAPIPAPTSSPSAVPTVTAMPSFGPTVSHAPFYSSPPTQVRSLSPTEMPTSRPPSVVSSSESSILPYVIPISALALIAISAAFYIKTRRGHHDRALLRKPTLLHHKQLRSGDDDSDDLDLEDSVVEMAVGSSLTKDIESGDSAESIQTPMESSPVERSISTNETMKAGNLRDVGRSMEEKWMNSSTKKSGDIKFPVKLNGNPSGNAGGGGENLGESSSLLNGGLGDSAASEKTPTNPATSVAAAVASSPIVKSLFGKSSSNSNHGTPNSNAMFKSSTPTKGLNASPVTKVTPSKVSKEEFAKGWDDELPFHWNPEPSNSASKSTPKKKDRTPRKDVYSDNDIQGSFPSFDMADDLPLSSVQNRSLANSSLGTSMQSGMETNSSYRSLNEMHPMDWSNKGSEMDGTSVGNSTLTDGDSTGKNPSQDFQWQGRINSAVYSGAFLGESNTPTSVPKPLLSGRSSTFGSKSSTGSSPRSRGSSKQLIHDIVWLEKKIADVRSRVDRLDGDESRTSSPPISPKSPSSTYGSNMSPISTNIVCRDIIAPPGKLQIIIHSTKDGPAIHSVKPGSVLEGQVFSGDLIVAVNDTDTRAFDAEAVMEFMARHSAHERKLTVLHAV